MSTPKKSNTKHFLTKEDKVKLIALYQEGRKFRDIAREIGSSTRQVKETVRRFENNVVKKFTPEEDQIIREKYLSGMTKEWQIWTFIPNKEPYMIRNRIKSLLRKNLMFNNNEKVDEFDSLIPSVQSNENSYIGNSSIDLCETEFRHIDYPDEQDDALLNRFYEEISFQ